jgi:hypothetical protein
MESKHTTRFIWKKACKKINRFVYILTDFGIGSLVIIIYIGHYFLPVAYVIFILTQRLVPVFILTDIHGTIQNNIRPVEQELLNLQGHLLFIVGFVLLYT